MTPDDLRQDVELKVVELIKKKLAEGTMTEARSQTVAQQVLGALKPGMSFTELYKAIFHLDDQYTELSPIILPIIRDYEKNVTKKAEDGVRELIRQGQFDAAEKLGKKAVSGDLNIVWSGSSNGK